MDSYMPMENSFSDDSNLLTPNVINLLNASLSKSGISILMALYHTPRMQQKSLAASIHTSPNSLCNIINRLETLHPSVLTSERIGRSKYYSLTKVAELYVSHELLPRKTAKIHTFVSPLHDDTLADETLHLLYQFQSTAGIEWFLIMDNLLSEQPNIQTSGTELSYIFHNFIGNLKQLHIAKRIDVLHKVYDILDNNILIRRLEQYLKKELDHYFELEPLFLLERTDMEKAFLLIDYIFSQLKPRIFCVFEMDYIFNIISISKEQYFAIYHRISYLINDFQKYNGNTLKAIECWKNEYYSSNASLYHIVEKCNTVYLLEYKHSVI